MSRLRQVIPLLFLLLASVALGATDYSQGPDDDFSPLAYGFIVIGFFLMLLIVGIGIVLGVVMMISGAVLVSLGIVSSSALIGVLAGRFSSGLRALHYQVCAAATLPAGMGMMALYTHFAEGHWLVREMLVVGAVVGICSGLVLALIFDRAVTLAYRRWVLPTILPSERGYLPSR